jgi:hypothetical protein
MATEPTVRKDYRLALLTGAVILALYLAACVTPAVQIKLGPVPGFMVLLTGWNWPELIPWSANCFLVAGMFCLLSRKYVAAWNLGLLATVLGLTSWGFVWPMKEYQLSVGYFLWQASLIVLAWGARAALLRTRPGTLHIETSPGERMPSDKSPTFPGSPSSPLTGRICETQV